MWLYHCLVAVPRNTSPLVAARLYGYTTCSNNEFYVFQAKNSSSPAEDHEVCVATTHGSLTEEQICSWRAVDVVLVSAGMKKGISFW